MMHLKVKSPLLLGLAVFLAVVIVVLWCAPSYLIYENNPRKTDCIILLVGPDYELRKNRALTLIAEGYSNYLVIPALKMVFEGSDKAITPLDWHSDERSDAIDEIKRTERFRLYENTHLEILFAKEIVERLRFHSMTFVSSPYQMRRVKIIAERDFKAKGYDLSYVTYEDRYSHPYLWMFKRKDLKWITTEYMKIAWFMIYTSLS